MRFLTNVPSPSIRVPQLGLGANWRQFALLVAVNAFVGGMVGLERTTLPLLAEADFGITSTTAAVSFIASFGLAKAVTNLFAGHLSSRFSRRSLLIAGWLLGLPVPLILIWAQSWTLVIGANLLLGVNQGLAWAVLPGHRLRGLWPGFERAVRARYQRLRRPGGRNSRAAAAPFAPQDLR